jgi:hypothetical protein
MSRYQRCDTWAACPITLSRRLGFVGGRALPAAVDVHVSRIVWAPPPFYYASEQNGSARSRISYRMGASSLLLRVRTEKGHWHSQLRAVWSKPPWPQMPERDAFWYRPSFRKYPSHSVLLAYFLSIQWFPHSRKLSLLGGSCTGLTISSMAVYCCNNGRSSRISNFTMTACYFVAGWLAGWLASFPSMLYARHGCKLSWKSLCLFLVLTIWGKMSIAGIWSSIRRRPRNTYPSSSVQLLFPFSLIDKQNSSGLSAWYLLYYQYLYWTGASSRLAVCCRYTVPPLVSAASATPWMRLPLWSASFPRVFFDKLNLLVVK